MSKQEPESPAPITIAGIEISVADQSPLVLALLGVIQKQAAEIQDLRDEIQRLKKTTVRPIIKPSRLLLPIPDEENEDGTKKKRPGSEKRKKTKTLRIDVDEIIPPAVLPPDAKFEGYRDFIVQDIVMESRNTRYRRAVYRLPDGTLIVGQRPDGVDSHFGPALTEFILLQTHQNHVTQGRLLEQLTELKVDISSGQLSNILLKGHDNFHAENCANPKNSIGFVKKPVLASNSPDLASNSGRRSMVWRTVFGRAAKLGKSNSLSGELLTKLTAVSSAKRLCSASY